MVDRDMGADAVGAGAAVLTTAPTWSLNMFNWAWKAAINSFDDKSLTP